jgi:hypothetical protein
MMDDLELRSEMQFRQPVRRLRTAARAWRAPDELRERLLRDFDAVQAARRVQPRWALMAAAAALIAAALTMSWHFSPQSAAAVATSSQTGWDQLAGSAEGEFVAVPYAPPLAPGESVDVIRTQLDTQALERMGVNIALASAASAQINADLVLGQDGLPRAVRVLGQAQF